MSRVERTGSAARRRWLASASVLACVAAFAAIEPVSTQSGREQMLAWLDAPSGPAPGEVAVLPVQGNVHMIVGAGANITVQAGNDGILMVDTGTAPMAEKVWAAVRTISERPLRYVINTTEHEDHAGANAIIAAKGEIIPWRDPNYTAGPQGYLATTPKASVISYLTVFHRMAGPTGSEPAVPEEGWPDNTYSTPEKRLYFNDEPVVILHQPSNTDGNSLVLFRKSDVVSAGKLLDLTNYPLIDLEAGGSVQAVIDGLNRLISLAVPAANAEGGTMIVPAHGRIADHAEVVYHRNMVSIIRDRVQDLIEKGMTLEQIQAARPTRDYDARYGRTTGDWTTEDFVEAVYQSLRAGS